MMYHPSPPPRLLFALSLGSVSVGALAPMGSHAARSLRASPEEATSAGYALLQTSVVAAKAGDGALLPTPAPTPSDFGTSAQNDHAELVRRVDDRPSPLPLSVLAEGGGGGEVPRLPSNSSGSAAEAPLASGAAPSVARREAPRPLAHAGSAAAGRGGVVAGTARRGSSADGRAPPEPRFRVFDSGFCSAGHAWSPGNHGCSYVPGPEECLLAAQELSLLLGNSTTGVASQGVRAFRNAPSLALAPELGCLLEPGGAVSFSFGPGRGACGPEARCICDCAGPSTLAKAAAARANKESPDTVDLLALMATTLLAAVGTYTTTHQPCLLRLIASPSFLALA